MGDLRTARYKGNGQKGLPNRARRVAARRQLLLLITAGAIVAGATQLVLTLATLIESSRVELGF